MFIIFEIPHNNNGKKYKFYPLNLVLSFNFYLCDFGLWNFLNKAFTFFLWKGPAFKTKQASGRAKKYIDGS